MPTRIERGASCACSAAGERGIARNVIPKALTNPAAASPPVSAPGSVRICFDLDVAPGLGDTSCQATSADRSFLQGPWAGGANDKDPKGQVNVGTFGAQPNNFIFFRENY